MNLTFDDKNFYNDGKPYYFNSGEIHYYRAPKSEWRKRLQLLKDSSCNTVATYIPWRTHEKIEGEYRFDLGDSFTDLTEFLSVIKDMDMNVIVRPGPYTYSELMVDGLPDYLLEKYPEILAKNKKNQPIAESTVTYLHPIFLERTRLFYQRVCKILRPFLKCNGGPIIMIQLDNETFGVQSWRGSFDYSEVLWKTDCRYGKFLEERYKTVDFLNQRYGTCWKSFAEADPCVDLADPAAALLQEKDYVDFSCLYGAVFLKTLASFLEENGITNTVLCNNAGSPNLFACLKETYGAFGSNFVIGADHYWNLGISWGQNNPTLQRFMYHYISCEIMRSRKRPAWVPEFQYGSVSAFPPVRAEDLSCALFTHFGFGMRGHNGYVFSGGPNPPGDGWSCQIYDYYAPVSARGEVRPTYYATKDYHEFIGRNPQFFDSVLDYDLPVLFDFNIYRQSNNNLIDSDNTVGNAEISNFFSMGICACGLTSGIIPNLLDMDDDFDMNLKNLCVVSNGIMRRSLQEKLVEYMQNGGNLLLFGAVPVYDEFHQECRILADSCGMKAVHRMNCTSRCFDFNDIEGETVFNSGAVFLSESLPDGAKELLVECRSGKIAAYSIAVGKGKLVYSGTLFSMACESHNRYFMKLFAEVGGEIRFKSDNMWMLPVRQKVGDDTYFFFTNASTSVHELNSSYQADGSFLNLPTLKLNPMDVKIIRLSDGKFSILR